MAACFVDLTHIDVSTTYEQGFMSIRQLALLQRQAMNTSAKDAYKQVSLFASDGVEGLSAQSFVSRRVQYCRAIKAHVRWG